MCDVVAIGEPATLSIAQLEESRRQHEPWDACLESGGGAEGSGGVSGEEGAVVVVREVVVKLLTGRTHQVSIQTKTFKF